MPSFYHELRIEPLYIARICLDQDWRTENFSPQYRIVPHCRLHFALAGEAHIEFAGEKFLLTPGKMILTPPNITTRVWCDDFCEVFWAKFDVFYGDSYVDFFSMYHPKWENTVTDMEFYQKLFINTLPDGKRQFHHADPFLPEACLRIILYPFIKDAETRQAEKTKDPNLLFPLLQYINTHLNEPFSLKELGKKFNLNPTYLTNLFARQMGFSLIEYCNRRKINRAEQLLATTDMTVSEIAYSLGFSTPDNFSRMFKKMCGTAPKLYRKEHIQELF